MWNPFRREERSLNLNDSTLAEFLGIAPANAANVPVTPVSSLGMTAVYRAVSLLSGTVAGLPLHTYQDVGELRERTPSFLDDPGAVDDWTPFEFHEYVMVSLLLHGNAFLLHRFNMAGALIGLLPIHPSMVTIEGPTGQQRRKRYQVTMADGSQRTLTTQEMTHIRAMSHDGIRGLSPIQAARQSIATGLAGDKTAARTFGSGLLIGGMVTTSEDVEKEEAEELKREFKAKVLGHDNAGDIAFVNRNLNFTPWNMNAKDAQFIEARGFQVEEIARLYGIPKALLAEDGASTWGAGLRELIHGMVKFTFMSWSRRIEQRLARLLPEGQQVEYDYAGLLQGNHQEVIANMAAEINAGLLSVNEARRKLNRPPRPEGEDRPVFAPPEGSNASGQ